MGRSDRLFAARHADEHISERSCVFHLHDVISVHFSFHCFDGIYLGHDDPCSKSSGPHRDASSAPSVACDYDGLRRYYEVGVPHDRIPDGLARSVAVVEEVLAVRVVDGEHRELQDAFGLHSLEPDDACRRLFASAPYLFSKIRSLSVDHADEIAAVIDDDVRSVRKAHLYVAEVFFFARSVDGEYIYAVICESSCDIVLSREDVASCCRELRAAGREDLAQIGRLRLHVDRERYLHAFERLRQFELLFKTAKKRHVVFDPLYLSVT